MHVSTLCGSKAGENGLKDGTGQEALLNFPYGMVSVEDNAFVISEFDNHVLRIVEDERVVPTDSENQDGQISFSSAQEPA
jgi:hypothetical protein